MHSIERPYDDLLVLPSDVWENLSPEQRESAIQLLTKLAYEFITAGQGQHTLEGSDESSTGNE